MRLSKHSEVLRHIPFLIGALVMASAAISAVTLTVNEPPFETLIHFALVVSIAIAFIGILRKRVFVLPGGLYLFAGITMFHVRYYLPPAMDIFFPPEVVADDDVALATMLSWLMVGFCSWLSNRRNFVLCVVSGLAAFGLMGTVNLNVQIWVAFGVFIFGAVFCWGYESYLENCERTRKTVGSGKALASWWEVTRLQIAVAALLSGLALVAAAGIGAGAHRVSPNLYARIGEQVYGWNISQLNALNYSTFESRFNIGTGPINLSDAPVLRVRTPYPGLWRGMVYDQYEGGGWSRRSAMQMEMEVVEQGRYKVQEAFHPHGTFHTQHIVPVRHMPVVFGRAQPVEVIVKEDDLRRHGRRPERFSTPLVDAYGAIAWSRFPFGERVPYQVNSVVPLQDPDTLRATPTDYPQWVRDTYILQVPANTAAGLTDIVQSVTRNAATPYDKVVALQTYLEERCVYTLAGPATPFNQDAVNYFVLRSRRGACDLFSSALAVMSRMAGVPARVATGYNTGVWDSEDQSFVVRESDAHAWTEIYFPTVGWVAFDPQARESEGDGSLNDMVRTGNWQAAFNRTMRRGFTVLLIVAVVLVSISALFSPVLWLKKVLRRRPRTPLERLANEYESFRRTLMRDSGLPWDEALTPRESIAAIAERRKHVSGKYWPRLWAFNALFYRVCYSADQSDEKIAEARKLLAELRSEAKTLQRRTH